MSILGKLEALFTEKAKESPVPETWPNEEEPGYYEDRSVGTYEMPPTAATEDKWAPTADQVVPGYRGVEEHGVPYDAAQEYIIPMDQATAEAREHDEELSKDLNAETTAYEEPIPPLPVTVVEMPTPIARQSKLAVTSYTLDIGSTFRIVSANHQRDKVKIRVIDTQNTLFVHPDKQAATTVGYPVNFYNELELDTTEAVYAFCPANSTVPVVVYILEEYSVETHERTV